MKPAVEYGVGLFRRFDTGASAAYDAANAESVYGKSFSGKGKDYFRTFAAPGLRVLPPWSKANAVR